MSILEIIGAAITVTALVIFGPVLLVLLLAAAVLILKE